ncbi:hypothetical protein AVEN_4101-1 [Araneus ventricosus]|uniref:Uncharacterized protein n=1 Tax=Araneus ventricosus TaxID=182803 RepID=A0A4Y2IVM4_ARAVE|nr:hypothetical protein AVEN_4101-1 [Araneus ventricosus]
MKRKIIEKPEGAVIVADTASSCNRSASTICIIRKNKETIEEIHALKGVTRMSPKFLEDAERLFVVWMHEKRLRGDNFNQNIICGKVKVIFADRH